MKTRIIALAALLFLAIGMLSAKSLVLTLKNNTRVYYLLGGETNPMMRFIHGDIIVNADNYEFSNIKNFYISATDDPSGIEQTTKGATARICDNSVIFETDKPLSVRVYSSNGREVKVIPIQMEGQTIVNLHTLPQGAYIITTGDATLKIVKR
jgi:hypothetical protein